MIFPTNFLWGASTSAFQVEGGYNEGGKGVATTDLGARRPGIADNKVAADHYHHWKEDVNLMAELGLKDDKCEYIAIGETTMRFASVTPRAVNGVNIGGSGRPSPFLRPECSANQRSKWGLALSATTAGQAT